MSRPTSSSARLASLETTLAPRTGTSHLRSCSGMARVKERPSSTLRSSGSLMPSCCSTSPIGSDPPSAAAEALDLLLQLGPRRVEHLVGAGDVEGSHRVGRQRGHLAAVALDGRRRVGAAHDAGHLDVVGVEAHRRREASLGRGQGRRVHAGRAAELLDLLEARAHVEPGRQDALLAERRHVGGEVGVLRERALGGSREGGVADAGRRDDGVAVLHPQLGVGPALVAGEELGQGVLGRGLVLDLDRDGDVGRVRGATGTDRGADAVAEPGRDVVS